HLDRRVGRRGGVVQEFPVRALAELGVGARVQDEGVPGRVDLHRGHETAVVAAAHHLRAELEELQQLGERALAGPGGHLLALRDLCDDGSTRGSVERMREATPYQRPAWRWSSAVPKNRADVLLRVDVAYVHG